MDELPIEVDCEELKRRLDAGDPLLLVDCREPAEHEIASLPHARLVPMATVPTCRDDLAAESRPIVVYCHHGMRSLQTAQWLRAHGVSAQSLAGGIDAWAERIDPTTPRY